MVSSVIKTRVRDNNDIDLHKKIPYQNYFYNSEFRKALKEKEGSDSSGPSKKRIDKKLEKELEDHNLGILPTKRKPCFTQSSKKEDGKGALKLL